MKVFRKALMFVFTLCALANSGQGWQDAETGNGLIRKEFAQQARLIFPACETEDSDWCIWDADRRGNRVGGSFIVVSEIVIYFD